MSEATGGAERGPTVSRFLALGLGALVCAAFYFSTSGLHHHFDYTYRIAGALLHGDLGLATLPPSWLSEMVPFRGRFYSVFPLGAVLSVAPLALVHEFPARGVAALLAGGSAYFFFQLSHLGGVSVGRRILLACWPIFGTWTWCNLGFAGAWQLALGFALLGETAALYYTLVKPRPWLAGAWFAVAFGNRTELLLTAPIFAYFWITRGEVARGYVAAIRDGLREHRGAIVRFLAIPTALGLLTAAYNFARFGSPFDFGYARIPGILQEPWYRYGIFSLHSIPWNAFKMLFEGVKDIANFPYFIPYPFGCSIFLSSPFLFLLFREGGNYATASWLAIGMLTFILLCHGNPGGWQFSYRYAMTLLPWMFLILLGNGPRKTTSREVALFAVSVAINAVAAYQFLWTNQIKP